LKYYTEIQEMILDHIKELEDAINEVKNSYAGKTHYSPLQYAEMYKAKSLALQALADLKNGNAN